VHPHSRKISGQNFPESICREVDRVPLLYLWIMIPDDTPTTLLTPPPIFAKMLLKNVNDNGNVIGNNDKIRTQMSFTVIKLTLKGKEVLEKRKTLSKEIRFVLRKHFSNIEIGG
jgi:hypothetical protein